MGYVMSTIKTEKKTTNDQDNSNSLLDMSQSSVKKMMAQAKARGYITYDELNEFMPPEQVSSEQIEDRVWGPRVFYVKNLMQHFMQT